MSEKVMLNLILAFLMVSSAIVIVGATGEGDQALPPPAEEGSGIIEAPGTKDLGQIGTIDVPRIRTYDADDVGDLMAQLRSEFFSRHPMKLTSAAPSAGTKDENDDISNATEVFDGDSISSSVTSWIGGNNIHTSDVDFYLVNLTINGPSSKVDRIIIDIKSTDAESKNANLLTQFYYPDNLLGQWANLDFEMTGAHHGNTSRFVYFPKGEPTSTYILPIVFQFISYNSTAIDYSFTVDIQTVTRSDTWNGELNGASFVNKTIRPAALQNVNISHEFYDWFDLSALITDAGLQEARQDKVTLSLRVDAATEERGQMYTYGMPSGFGKLTNASTIMSIFFIYHNYTSGQWTIQTDQGGNIPFASCLFTNGDPVPAGFIRQKIDAAFIGLAPYRVIHLGNGWYGGAEGNGEFQYNLTNIAVEILPPNDPPAKIGTIPDFSFDEDTGPWEDIVDLEQYFTDDWSDNDLRFEVRPVGTPPKEITVSVAPDGKHLRINVSADNWYTPAGAPLSYQVLAYDWGQDWKRDSGDDLKVLSNVFKVTINPVNDDSYILKVDTNAGTVDNDHEWIVFQMTQIQFLKTRKIFGMDNDTADKNNLIYTSNATTTAFRMNDKGQFDFIPTNEHVGTTWIRVAVDDGNPPEEDDYCLLKFIVTNINDGPELLSIRNRDSGASFDLKKTDEASFFNILEDAEVNLTVTADDPDIVIYQPDQLSWSVGAVGWTITPDPDDPFTAYITYTPTNGDAVIGEARTKFFVRDSQQLMSKEVEIILYVDNVNDPPTILAVNDELVEDGAVTLNAANRKAAKEDTLYTLTVLGEDIDPKDEVRFLISDMVNFVQVPLSDEDFGTSFQIQPSQDMVGMQQVMITVMDKKDRKTTVRVNYEVNGTNDPPGEPKMDVTALTGFKVEQTIKFQARDVVDIDGDELTIEWNFGDGSPYAYGMEVEHVYTFGGAFTVSLIVRDPSGEQTIARRPLTIAEKEIVIDPNLDTDGDGMPDVWELLYAGFDINDPSDANDDFDKDGFTNLDEYKNKDANGDRYNPLDKNSHPPVTKEEKSDYTLIIVIIVAAVIVLIIIIVLFAFLLRTPKQVQPQMMYGREASPQLPPRPPQQPALEAKPQPQLPPKPEEDLMEGFLEEAAKEVKDSMDMGQEEDNVWRPPAPVEEPEKSQVDDLFDDQSEQKAPVPKADAQLAPPPMPPK
jgi:hypothetical protein